MIHFIYGENTFFIEETAKKMVDDFVKAESSDLNLQILDGETLEGGIFSSAANSLPFLGTKRFLLVKNFLTRNSNAELKKSVVAMLKTLPETTELVFVELGQPDKRETIYKYLEKNAEKNYFGPLTEYDCRRWIADIITQEGMKIAPTALSKLYYFVGSDLWRLKNEIGKLVNFAKSKQKETIEDGDVELLVSQNNNYKIFDLTDALAVKDLKKASLVLHKFLDDGEEPLRVFNLIVHQLRTMIIVADLAKSEPESAIAKITKMHPFVIKKNLSSLRHFSSANLAAMYNQLCNYDFDLKNGSKDPTLALDLLLVDFCKK